MTSIVGHMIGKSAILNLIDFIMFGAEIYLLMINHMELPSSLRKEISMVSQELHLDDN